MPTWSAIGLTAVRGMASTEIPATVVVVPAPAAAAAEAAAEARVGDLSLGPALLFCLVLSCLSAGCQHPGPLRVR